MSYESIIEVDRVSKFYGRVMGLNDISVKFGPGITGLLGPNGAGKSTMLKLIMGQIRPSLGKITAFDQKVWNNPSLNQRIGYCPEQDSFYPWMTGFEFVKFCATLNGVPNSKAKKMAVKALKTVDLKKDMGRKIGGYSKGMRQRVKIAQSIVHEPLLLVLDEPLAGTDPLGRLKIINLLFKLEKQGKHIIVSSHVLHEVERITRSIVLINKGKLIAQGDIQSIRDSMDKFPLNIRIRTDSPRRLAKLLSDNEFVISVYFPPDKKDTVIIMTSRPDMFYPDFQQLVINKSLTIYSIDSPDDSLDAVFKYLVG
jgi:ABC-2 type transport system ATP-binding protein